MNKSSDEPPEPPALTEEETEALLRERMKTFERERKDARPWEEVKARILADRS